MHALLSASAAERWLACPISVTGGDADSGSRAAAEGTFLHHVCEGVLTGGSYPTIGAVHHVDGYDFTFTADMLSDCQAYVDFVQSKPWASGFQIEQLIHYGRALGTPHNLSFGTADCSGITVDAEGPCLEIVDLKMGRKPVNPYRNPQAVLYASGVLEGIDAVAPLPRAHRARVTIFQPRLSHKPFEWLTTVGEIRDMAASYRPAAQAAVRYATNAVYPTDPEQFPELVGKHCHYCRRKSQCASLQRSLAVVQPGATVQWNPELFKLRDVIRAYLDDIEQLAVDAALQGTPFDGTKLVKGRAGNPKLRVTNEQLVEAAKAKGIEAMVTWTEQVYATPAKVRDAFKKVGASPEELANLIETPEGKAVIADANDPRALYVSQKANTSVFSGVAQNPVL